MATALVVVNENASGAWATRAGTVLEFVAPGLNRYHVLVRYPGDRREFGLPARWLDGLDLVRP